MLGVLIVALAYLSANASAYCLSSSEPTLYVKGDQLAANVLPLAGEFSGPVSSLASGFGPSSRPTYSPFGQRPSKPVALQPIGLFSLPFCGHVHDGARRGMPSFMSLLLGGQSPSAAYEFRMMVEEKLKSPCDDDGYEPSLSGPQAEDLRKRIQQGYGVRLELDGLPVTTIDLQLDPDSVRLGFPLGFSANGRQFVNNHLMFLVLVHQVDDSERQPGFWARKFKGVKQTESSSPGPVDQTRNSSSQPPPPAFAVVGIMVVPCSIRRRPGGRGEDVPCPVSLDDPDAPEPQEVTKGAQIAYTYDVYWEKSDVTWDRRWDSYARLPAAWERARWLSALISGLVAAGLVVAAIVMVRRTVRERSASYQLASDRADLEERRVAGTVAVADGEAAKTVAVADGEAAKTAVQWRRLCGVVGFWILLAIIAATVLGTAAAGCISSSMRGQLLPLVSVASMLVATMLALAPLESVTGPFYDNIVARRVTRPGMALIPLIQLYQCYNLKYGLISGGSRSSGGTADRMSVFLMAAAVSTSALSRLWCTGMLLSSLRAISARDASVKAGRHMAVADGSTIHRAALYVACSILPFAACAVEYFIAMTCVWQGYAYSVSAPVLLTATITAVISVEISVISACAELPTHDSRWWLRTFQRAVSPAVCFLLSSLPFLAIQLRPKSLPDAASFLLWTVLVITAASGVVAIGFLSTFLLMKMLARTMGAEGITATTGNPVCTEESARAQRPLLGKQCDFDTK